MTNLVLDRVSEKTTGIPESMVLIAAGEFLMGSEEGSEVERPVHRVYLDAYFLDSTPVTNEEFAKFVKATGYRTTAETLERILTTQEGALERQLQSWRDFAGEGRQDHPVVFVSWHDADAYAKWAGKRLPTEAEWEKAACGGLEAKKFPWGNEAPGDFRTNWNQVRQESSSMPPTKPVSSFPPNGYGLYDMVGNVWEWCGDWYFDPYYVISPSENPQGPDRGQYRVRRGASWNVREDFRLRCANRGAMPPDRYWPNLGFRCARSVLI